MLENPQERNFLVDAVAQASGPSDNRFRVTGAFFLIWVALCIFVIGRWRDGGGIPGRGQHSPIALMTLVTCVLLVMHAWIRDRSRFSVFWSLFWHSELFLKGVFDFLKNASFPIAVVGIVGHMLGFARKHGAAAAPAMVRDILPDGIASGIANGGSIVLYFVCVILLFAAIRNAQLALAKAAESHAKDNGRQPDVFRREAGVNAIVAVLAFSELSAFGVVFFYSATAP